MYTDSIKSDKCPRRPSAGPSLKCFSVFKATILIGESQFTMFTQPVTGFSHYGEIEYGLRLYI